MPVNIAKTIELFRKQELKEEALRREENIRGEVRSATANLAEQLKAGFTPGRVSPEFTGPVQPIETQRSTFQEGKSQNVRNALIELLRNNPQQLAAFAQKKPVEQPTIADAFGKISIKDTTPESRKSFQDTFKATGRKDFSLLRSKKPIAKLLGAKTKLQDQVFDRIGKLGPDEPISKKDQRLLKIFNKIDISDTKKLSDAAAVKSKDRAASLAYFKVAEGILKTLLPVPTKLGVPLNPIVSGLWKKILPLLEIKRKLGIDPGTAVSQALNEVGAEQEISKDKTRQEDKRIAIQEVVRKSGVAEITRKEAIKQIENIKKGTIISPERRSKLEGYFK